MRISDWSSDVCSSDLELEVAHDGLAGAQELVEQDVPRSYGELAAVDQGGDPLLVLRSDLQVVGHDGHLPVQGEPEVWVGLGSGDDVVHHVDQAQPEHLERLVPLPDPVGVRHENNLRSHAEAAYPAGVTP